MEKAVFRHELKYYISRPGAELIHSRLKHLMRPDAHTDGFKPYFIRSLYFDDFDYTAYRDKLSGVSDRNKYRIRFYNMDRSYVVFEKKQKISDRILKSSVKIDPAQQQLMLEGKLINTRDSGLLREYDILTKNCLLRPLVIVDYDRTVYSYPVSNVRITLDKDIRARRFAGELFDSTPASVPVTGKDECVLEVKFDTFLPPQIECLIRDIPKARSAVSKYCMCCEIL